MSDITTETGTDPHNKSYCPGDDDYMCDRGDVWIPCESPYCYGACVYDGPCDCQCHLESKSLTIHASSASLGAGVNQPQ